METKARFASGNASSASSQLSTLTFWSVFFLLDKSFKNESTFSKTWSKTDSSCASTTIAISLAPAASSSSVNKPAPLKMSLLASVAIMTCACVTPSKLFNSADKSIRLIES